jgi:hypothetical protein
LRQCGKQHFDGDVTRDLIEGFQSLFKRFILAPGSASFWVSLSNRNFECRVTRIAFDVDHGVAGRLSFTS